MKAWGRGETGTTDGESHRVAKFSLAINFLKRSKFNLKQTSREGQYRAEAGIDADIHMKSTVHDDNCQYIYCDEII